MRSNHEALEGLKLREKLRESFAAQQRADLAEAEDSQASQRLTSEAAERKDQACRSGRGGVLWSCQQRASQRANQKSTRSRKTTWQGS